MHEYGLAEGVLDTVRQRADGRKVAAIKVRFGVRHAVDAESMSQAFTFVASGTEAADATVDTVIVPARLTCRTASADTGAPLRCPGTATTRCARKWLSFTARSRWRTLPCAPTAIACSALLTAKLTWALVSPAHAAGTEVTVTCRSMALTPNSVQAATEACRGRAG